MSFSYNRHHVILSFQPQVDISRSHASQVVHKPLGISKRYFKDLPLLIYKLGR
jgi:hypothetical protein